MDSEIAVITAGLSREKAGTGAIPLLFRLKEAAVFNFDSELSALSSE